MNKKWIAVIGSIGCLMLVLVLAAAVLGALFIPTQALVRVAERQAGTETELSTPVPGIGATQEAIPTLQAAQAAPKDRTTAARPPSDAQAASLPALYEALNPGVVNIRVFVERGQMTGQGAGSGFILDERGYIVTNNHVVANASQVSVVFHDGSERPAEIVGLDADSDLAVIRVDELPDGVHPLALGDSDALIVGQWVIAIGNPFSLGGSMSTGIISALGRTIPSGATPFSIPQAIQTDAAINPGNSGGPLLDLQGEVIGVNAQIVSGTAANSGVGFAIPVNVVRQVVPVLIDQGNYRWPWLGVQGGSLNLLLREANNLEIEQGAYISGVVPNGPADQAGLEGSTDSREVNGLEVPVGGDVVIAADGQPVESFDDLLSAIAFKSPEDSIDLTILRGGEQQTLTVELEARPIEFEE